MVRLFPYQAMFKQAAAADIIITSTGAPHYVLTAENLGPLLPERHGRPLILIDIAVPRDVSCFKRNGWRYCL